jgi:sugar O-acyltransferase (sialic acid O-acetyltransferase NeuD family)
MKDLAIYGAGGFGREVELLIEQINRERNTWNFLGFFDDAEGERPNTKVIGNGKVLQDSTSEISIVIAIADPQIRSRIVSKLTNPKIHFPTLIHPKADTGAASNMIGRGSVITQGVILTTGISLGEFVIVNLGTTIGHDCVIGDCCSIMPGASISGSVHIGANTLVGTGASILQNIHIGSNARVGAGAVVTRDVKASDTVVGVPAKSLKRK